MIILCIELCSMQQNKPRSDRRSIRREGSGEKSPLLSYFFGTTTINSVMGNSKRRRNLGQRQKEKKMPKRSGRHICIVRAVVSTRRR